MRVQKNSLKGKMQKDKRESKLMRRKEVNNAPQDPYDQECPRKLRDLYKKLPQKVQKQNKVASNGLLSTADFIEKDTGSYPAKGRPLKPLPVVEQLPNESKFRFFKRVSAATKMVIGDSKFETQHKVDLQRNMMGEVVGVKHWKDDKIKKKNERKRLKRKEYDLKRKAKRKKKVKATSNSSFRNSSGENLEADLLQEDTVKFGEVVHAPPDLQTDKLDKKIRNNKKMKVHNSIFLQSFSSDTHSFASDGNQSKPLNRVKVLEEEREKVVFAYRQLKFNELRNQR